MNASDLSTIVKKQPIGFACGALCLVLAALLYYRSSKIGESQVEYDAKSAEAAKILTNVRNSSNLAEQVTAIQGMTEELNNRLVHAGGLAVNLQYFYKLEAENAVKLMDIRQSSPAKNAKNLYLSVPYTVAVQGGYKQVMAFLYRLEAGPHFCRFISVNLSKNPASTAADAMSLSLSIELLGIP